MTWSTYTVALACMLGLVACGGGNQSSSSVSPAVANEAGPTADDGEAQAARGAKLYAAKCASCHGQSGEGIAAAPPVVGANALPLDPPANAKHRDVQFHTALDVAQWVVKNMPPDAPGTLPESEYWDILAFDLKANGVPVAGKRIDATTAAAIKLH